MVITYIRGLITRHITTHEPPSKDCRRVKWGFTGAGFYKALFPKGPCARLVYTLALKYSRPKYILFGYMDP